MIRRIETALHFLFQSLDNSLRGFPIIGKISRAIFALSLFLLLPSRANADHYWDGGGSGDSWHTANNWNPNSVPVSTTRTYLAGAGVGTAQVVAAGAACKTLNIGDGTPGSKWILQVSTGGVLTVGDTLTCGTNGTVLVSTGTLAVGSATLHGGTLNLSGGTLSCSNFDATVGIFTNSGGRLVVSNGTLSIGSLQGRITGLNDPEWVLDHASISAPWSFCVGYAGAGRLTMRNGTVLNNELIVGFDFGGQGNVTITGPGTVLDGPLWVGRTGSRGDVYLRNSATATCSVVSLGGTSIGTAGDGRLTVEGPGTLLTVPGKFDVGGYSGNPTGHGEMIISNSARVQVADMFSVWPGDTVTVRQATLNVKKIQVDPAGALVLSGGGVLEAGNYKGDLLQNSGIVAPGGDGQQGWMTVSGSFLMSNTPTLAMDIGGTTMGTEYDHLVVSNQAGLYGILAVSICNGYIPDPGDQFDLIDWGTRQTNTEFQLLLLPALPPARAWDTSSLHSNGVLAITQTWDTVHMYVLGGLFDTLIPWGDTTPEPLDGTEFGDLLVGAAKTNTFKMKSSGSTNLTVYGSTITGPDAEAFTLISPSFPVNLPWGASTNFTIAFHPTSSGIHTATIIFTNDGIGQNPYTFVVQGRGAALPGVETAPVSNVGPDSAECGGTVTDDGGLTVGLRGCCWNTAGSPTLANNHTENGSGTGAFASTLTNLTAGMLYSVRAYATNELGVAYGEERQFATLMTPPGNLLDFDGTNDMVDLGSNSVLALTNGAFTIEAWIKPTTKANICTIMGRKITGMSNPGYALFYNTWSTTDRRLIFETHNQSVTTASPVITFDVWQHVAVTWDETNVLLYVNGVQKPASGGVDMADDGQHTTIGAFPGNSFFMDGQMDEVRIWSVARSESVLRDNMHRQLSGTETGLLAYYDCNVQSGTTLPDLTTNGLDGALTGAPTWAYSTIPCAVEIEAYPELRGTWAGQTNSLYSSVLSLSNAVTPGTSFRVFGHNDGPLAYNLSDKPTGVFWRLDRAWRMEGPDAVTGRVNFACTALSNLVVGASNLVLLADDDGIFSNATIVSGAYVGGTFRSDKQALQDGAWYTLAEVPGRIRYVWTNSPVNGPGTAWTNAFRTIQGAVNAAAAGDFIVVTNGTYPLSAEIDVSKNLAIQSVNGPENTFVNGNGTVRCFNLHDGLTVLSGFTLTNGYDANFGGAVYCDGYTPIITNCVITGNRAGFYGGGVRRGTINNCVIQGNISGQYGGGAANSLVNNSTLIGNVAAEAGGGVDVGSVNGCAIISNTAQSGGGIMNCTIRNSILRNNTATDSGGGCGRSKVYNSLILDNVASNDGGGFWASDVAPIDFLYNCTVIGNSAGNQGGGTCYGGGAYNSIVYNNTAPIGSNRFNAGFTVYSYCCTTPDATNGTGNIAADPMLLSYSHIATNSPCVGAGSNSYATGTDLDGEAWKTPPSIGCDEVYANALTGSLSVAILGEETYTYTNRPIAFTAEIEGKLYGNLWTFGDGIAETNALIVSHAWTDSGFYEVILTAFNDTYPAGVSTSMFISVTNIHYVNINNPSPVLPYTAWESAATSINDAVSATYDGGVVWVSNGTYLVTEEIDVPMNLTIRSVKGPDHTFVNGNGTVRCFNLHDGLTVLSGFTLTNGYDANSGGAVYCDGYTPIITNCVITGNRAGFYGGGVRRGTINNCVIQGNTSGQYGGGAANSLVNNSTLIGNVAAQSGGGVDVGSVNGCAIISNTAQSGGGIYNCTIRNSILRNNTATDIGGGCGRSKVYNSLILDNIASNDGGGFWASDVAPIDFLYNCTVIGNSAGVKGGGTCYGGGAYNSIVYNNTAPIGSNRFNAGFTVYSYCCTTPDATNGTGNIVGPPRFLGATDYHHLYGSPCIDTGTDLTNITTDLDGAVRPLDGNWDGTNAWDIGCYEYNPATADSNGDGVPDWWYHGYGLNPTSMTVAVEDDDEDTDENKEEWVALTDPTDSNSYFCVTDMQFGNSMAVVFGSSTERVYSLQSSEDMVAGLWLMVDGQTNVPGDVGGTTTLMDTNDAATKSYRVGVTLP